MIISCQKDKRPDLIRKLRDRRQKLNQPIEFTEEILKRLPQRKEVRDDS